MQNRLATVKKLSAIYYAVFEKAEQGLSCMFADANEKNKECCHALTLGLLIRGFSPFGQCVLRPSASRIFQSLSEFHLALSAVKVFTWPDEKYGEGSHEGCNFGPQLVADLKAAYDSTKSLVLDSHRLHMKVQWMKGEPETMQTPDS
jgi:hypothetical protein